MPIPLDDRRPAYGLSNREVAKRDADLAFMMPIMREALRRGDVGKVSEFMIELLDRFHLNRDRNSPGYRQLALAVLKAEVRALEALQRRSSGEPIDTPPMAHLEPSAELPTSGNTLSAAFAGWKKQRDRSPGSVDEYERACDLFTQLHGNLPVATITRDHARKFREALQDIPWPRNHAPVYSSQPPNTQASLRPRRVILGAVHRLPGQAGLLGDLSDARGLLA